MLKSFSRSVLLLIACLPFLAVYAAEDLDPAVSLSGRNREKEQRKFDYFYYEGLKLKNAGKYDQAFDAFNHCLSIDSTSAPLLYELSSFYIQMDKPQKAVELLKRAVANSTDNFSYRIALANITRGLGMYGEAVEEYEQLVKDYPAKVELNFYLAESLIKQGEIGKAVEAFDALELSIGMSEAISMQKFQLYSLLGEETNAVREIERLAEKFPMEPRYQIILGDLYLEKKDTVKALQSYNKAYELDPASPYYIVSMANYYEVTGDTEAAEQQIRNALVNEKLDVEVKVNILSRYIISLQQSQKDTDDISTSLFETLLEQHPEETELKLMYGGYLMLQGKEEEARFQFQLVTEMEPENAEAWQQLLQVAMTTRDYQEAIRVCKRCIELFPDSPEYYFYLGIAYFQLDQYEDALQTYQEGLEVIPLANNVLRSNFYGQIGDIYYSLKTMDKAFEAYEESLRYNDKNILVLNNYAYFLTLAGKDLKKAERMSAQTIKLEPENATYLDTYAWVFFMQGDYTMAKLYIEKALANDTENSAELVDHYGDILYMLGDHEKAREQWLKAKELGKESKVLEEKIGTGKYIESEEME